ncbi:MAG: FRG domain-containing protein [Chloroflexi bacterium]|nr:FRG domain-containing protein [Chloroflexota bacterium]
MSEIQEIEIRSLTELLAAVTPEIADPASGRLRDWAVYRGSGNANWPLLTSLDRLGGIDPAHTKAQLEEHILRTFIRYSRPYIAPLPPNEWELLVIAQHHGVPTRLLDWSYSPFVAAHFATLEPRPGIDRVVWRLDWKRVHEHFGFAPLAFLIEDLDEVLRGKGHESAWDLFRAEHYAEQDDCAFACLFDPPAVDTRLVAQSAAFTLCSDKNQSFDQFLDDCGLSSALTRYVIPAARVDVVRDQLDLCGIDERKIFPDLGGIAAQVRRYYSASGSSQEAKEVNC